MEGVQSGDREVDNRGDGEVDNRGGWGLVAVNNCTGTNIHMAQSFNRHIASYHTRLMQTKNSLML